MEKIRVLPLDKKRFNALAGLSRSPATRYFSEELAWYSNEDESILGVLLRDLIDDDFAAILLARDDGDRYRAFEVEASIESEDEARGWIERLIRWHTGAGLRIVSQDDQGPGPDLFTPVVPAARLHPAFVALANEPAFLPARSLITEMMPHYHDVDGNFVDQFQSTGFDSRLWELYLFAYVSEEELFLNRDYPAPDFIVANFGKEVAIEATIVGRREDDPPRYFKDPPETHTPSQILEAQEGLIPIRFGSPLYSKLTKRYWELPHIAGKPIVLAIADFHDDQSMLWTGSGLINYLYGVRHEFYHDETGRLVISPQKIETHKHGAKEIPSGYFFQKDAEHISAVLFSASGTISKFNRLGRQAGFAAPGHMMIRTGFYHDHDPDAVKPLRFSYVVDESREETWGEGVSMFHNPNAVIAVPEELFPSIAHHHFRNGQIESQLPHFHVYTSVTLNMRPRTRR